jgi:maltose O-acetyltransferase
MKRIANPLAALLYRAVATKLPDSTGPGGSVWRGIRLALARRMLLSVGEGANIEKGAMFNRHRIVSLGHRSGIGIDCRLYGPVQIRDDVMMGPEVVIYASSHDYSDVDTPMIGQGRQTDRPVLIDSNVWIGTRAIILPGVRIGEGAIVGAGAVVTRDVPEYAVVAGNPARVVRDRRIDSRGDAGV